MKIHPRLVTLIYCLIIAIIAIFIEKIIKTNILTTKTFSFIFIIGACIVSVISWKFYDD